MDAMQRKAIFPSANILRARRVSMIAASAPCSFAPPCPVRVQGRASRSRSRAALPIQLIALCVAILKEPALATFHFMQIEQVIGGVDGDTSAQAVQLRARSAGQNRLDKAKLIAWDAAGQNPVVLMDLDRTVAGDTAGVRVLIASAAFAKYTVPAAEPDFVLSELIPQSYLAAGSLTFENDEGTLLVWRLSWGGTSYTGATDGALTNDDNGDFGSAFTGSLPTSDLRALGFQGDSSAVSTTNDADYALSASPAVFTSNTGESFTVTTLNCPNDPDDDADGDRVCGDVDNCPETANADQADDDSDGHGNACDLCPQDPLNFTGGTCGCATPNADSDGDGASDCADNCPNHANANQSDRDDDGVGDTCDGCPEDPNKTAPGDCDCGAAELDEDGDDVPDCIDNCPGVANSGQQDGDDDGLGDACDNAPGTGSEAPPDDGSPDVGASGDDGPSETTDDGTTAQPTATPRACGLGILPMVLASIACPIIRWRRYHPRG